MRIFLFMLVTFLALPAMAELSRWEQELVYRTAYGSADDVALLAERLQKPNLVDDLGQPILFIAAARSDAAALPVVKALIAAGADHNEDGKGGYYPLIAAIQSGNAQVVDYLLSQGADYRVSDGAGIPALQYARQSGNEAVMARLDQAVKADQQAYSNARSPENYEKLRYGLAYNACALQYYTYYYASGQDEVSQSTQAQTLGRYKTNVNRAMGRLSVLFELRPGGIQSIFDAAKAEIFEEMEQMVSNRWRREKGVGLTGDMEERCRPIAKATMDAHYDQ